MKTQAIPKIKARPFLKWAGGKTQLIPEIIDSMQQKVREFDQFTYIEPFVGGGSVLLAVLQTFENIEKVVINDINQPLVNAYKIVKNDPYALIEQLEVLQKSYDALPCSESKQAFFLEKRRDFNQITENELVTTALLLFLNKTCFNGLYRVNSKGLFNVPFGKYKKPTICNSENILAVHHLLQKVEILWGDFSNTFKFISKNNNLFYFDPPYKPIKQTSSFTSYTKENFSDEDQFRLKQFCDKITQKGNYFILSNSDVKNFDIENHFFDDLYQDYCIKRVKAKRNINSKGNHRGEIFELLITNF